MTKLFAKYPASSLRADLFRICERQFGESLGGSIGLLSKFGGFQWSN